MHGSPNRCATSGLAFSDPAGFRMPRAAWSHVARSSVIGGTQMHDDEHIEDRLLNVLRRRTGVSERRYARPPTRLTGGFWAEILSVRLDGAPPELDRELVVRIMPD